MYGFSSSALSEQPREATYRVCHAGCSASRALIPMPPRLAAGAGRSPARQVTL